MAHRDHPGYHRPDMISRISFLVPLFYLSVVAGCAEVQDVLQKVKQAVATLDRPRPDQPRYGAIAYSQNTQRWHIRRNVADPGRASELAEKFCLAADCRVVLAFGPGQCGTFSLGRDGALGVGKGASKSAAENAALTQCSASGQQCKVAPTQCND